LKVSRANPAVKITGAPKIRDGVWAGLASRANLTAKHVSEKEKVMALAKVGSISVSQS